MTPEDSSFDPAIHLTTADIAIDSHEKPTLVRIHLKQSKTDKERKGIDVFLGASGDELCPVAALTAYLAIRGQSGGPFFRFQDGKPLTKTRFTQNVREALAALGLQEQSYTGHSFRIGAATTAAEAGIEDVIIKALGRWNSEAYQTYVKLSRARLGAIAASLSKQ